MDNLVMIGFAGLTTSVALIPSVIKNNNRINTFLFIFATCVGAMALGLSKIYM